MNFDFKYLRNEWLPIVLRIFRQYWKESINGKKAVDTARGKSQQWGEKMKQKSTVKL